LAAIVIKQVFRHPPLQLAADNFLFICVKMTSSTSSLVQTLSVGLPRGTKVTASSEEIMQ
jgi:hypothetical protein